MKNSSLQLIFAVLAVVFAGLFEEALPKIGGVGFPVLLAVTQYFAQRRNRLFVVLFALSAGAVEDALSGLPLMTSASAFLAIALFARRVESRGAVRALAFPFLQFWLYVWVPELSGSLFARILMAVPVGFVTAVVVSAALDLLERKAAIGEAA